MAKTARPTIEKLDEVAYAIWDRDPEYRGLSSDDRSRIWGVMNDTQRDEFRQYARAALEAVLDMQRFGLVLLDTGQDVIRAVEGRSRDTYISVRDIIRMLE